MNLNKNMYLCNKLFDYAKSLTALESAPWEKVKLIFSFCPQPDFEECFSIHPHSLDCIIALGTFYVQSGFLHTDKILPYLLNLLRGLKEANWLQENETSDIPYAESFSFCLNTLLSEVPASVKKDIYVYQLNEITNISSNLLSLIRTGFSNYDEEKYFLNILLPILFGLSQSMGRYKMSDGSFFCYLFPKYKSCIGIIYHLKKNYDTHNYNLISSACKQSDQMDSIRCKHDFERLYSSYEPLYLAKIFGIIQTLLSNETITLFNSNIFGTRRRSLVHNKFFYYNICELLKSIFIMLFKDIFCYQKNLSSSLLFDLKNFVEEFYLSLQNNCLDFDKKGIDLEELTFQRFKINVITNAISVELLSWAVCDLNDAEDLRVRVAKLLNSPYPEKLLIINAPLTIACCETLGNLAERFPGVAIGCVNILRDFLSLPSPTLAKLCHSSFLSCGNDSIPGKAVTPAKTVLFEHCIFKKVQYSAIENICLCLKVTFGTDNDYIASFLTSFSCLLYMEKSHPHYALVTENVVVTLGHLSFSVSTFSKSILQCFQQRLRRHSVESDIAIIKQLGNLIILNENEEIILETLKIFSSLILEVNSDGNNELKYISTILYTVLNNVAEKLLDKSKISLIFIRLLEIFVQSGLEEYQCSEISIAYKNACAKCNQDKLLEVISLLAEKLPNQLKLKKQQERLFQDLWLYFVLSMDLAVYYCDNPCLKALAPKLPSLNSDSLTDHDLREFFYTSSFNKAKISSEKPNIMRAQLLEFFLNSPDIAGVVNKLTFPQLIYSHSVCSLELFRIQNSEETSIEPLFVYLTNQKLQKDKYGMWQCICKIADKVFELFLCVMSNKERNDAREVILEKHALFLLIHFNNINPQVRHIADKFLSELIGRFPHLLWNRQVLWSLLDILRVLLYSLQISPSDQIMTLHVPNSIYSIHLMDTSKLRQEIFNDFVARSQEIISEARKWAPAVINSHLQEYILQEKSLFTKDYYITDLKNRTWSLLCSNQTYSVFEIGDILTSLSSRSHYMGEISGLLEKSKISSSEFAKNLSEAVWEACKEENIVKYESTLKRAAACAVYQESMQNEIKQVLATSQIKFFNREAMTVIVECWNWLCTVLPRFEFDLLKETFLAWQFTIDKKIGLFSLENVIECCGGNISQSQIKSKTCKHSDSHEIWVKFISQVIEGAKYCSQEKLELLVYFFHKTFPMTIGGSDCSMKRDSEYLICRFTLLSSALALLQSDISLTGFNRIIVRQRIYCTCLDYFCSLKEFPCNTDLNLKSCIEVLIKFWHIMYSDNKYILRIRPENNKELITDSKHRLIHDISPNFSDSLFYFNDSLPKHTRSTLLDGSNLEYSFFLDFKKKRKLSLCLLAEEIQFLSAWYNPCNQTELAVPGEDIIRAWLTKFYSHERYPQEIAKNAWEISPVLAVYISQRMKHIGAITTEISKLILLNPTSVSHVPHAVELLVTVDNIQKDCKALTHLLSWAEASPLQALACFSQNYPPHPIVLAYASKTLLNCNSGILVLYIPQLVQCLRHDPLGYVAEVIKAAAHKSPLFCHQVIWNMKANMYIDINMTQKSPLYEKLNGLLNMITENFSLVEKTFYQREFQFIDQITEVSGQIPRNLKHEERKQACLKALSKIKLKPGCYLPSNPRALVCDIDYKSGRPLQSKMRTPYLAKFQVALCSLDEVNEIGLKVSEQQIAGFPLEEIDIQREELGPLVWQPTIFKAGDDLRQDLLALQVIRLLKREYDRIGLDVFLFPYNVTAIAPGMGIIECVPNASSRDELGKQTNVGLYDYFITTFGDEKSTRFRNAQRNFIKSVAGYSVINFLLQIKDRHNGNILVDDAGHIIHIDFGFMFESSPGGNLGFEPDMKLTEEMVMIMGGKMESEPFRWFTQLCVQAYLAARSRQEEIITLVTLMLDSGLPCFRGQTIKLLRGRFAPFSSDREAADYIITVVRNSFLNFRTVTYDMLQYLQNSIQY